MTNPVPGLCPCCKDPKNSVFMQSIHSDGLFKMLLKRGDFKRNYLFCNKCIDWAKTEVLRLRERVPQNPQYSPISQSSEAGASRSTPDPFSEAMNDPMNDPMMEAHNNYSIVGQRLANPTDSPLHLAMSPLSYIPYDERLFNLNRATQMIPPLPSPLNQANQWEMNEDQKPKDLDDHINL